jgi:TorA maturation chaperone TorD
MTDLEKTTARSNLYAFLALGFSQPSEAQLARLKEMLATVAMSGAIISDSMTSSIDAATGAIASRSLSDLATEYQASFTYSASPDCPLNECAYGAKHIYQEVQELADIAGFYRAFGLEVRGERPDSLEVELEFCHLITLKEAIARQRKLDEEMAVCRDSVRAFLRDHLGRWADNIGRRAAVLFPGTAYESLGNLLSAFMALEIEGLQVGPLSVYQEVPIELEPLEEDGCAAEIGTAAFKLQQEDIIADLLPLATSRGTKEARL